MNICGEGEGAKLEDKGLLEGLRHERRYIRAVLVDFFVDSRIRI